MSDLISRQAAVDAFTAYSEYESNRTNADWVTRIHTVLRSLPPAQPEKRTEERTETHARDYISRQAAIDAHCDLCPDKGFCADICPDVEVFGLIPSAQPERKRGKWEHKSKPGDCYTEWWYQCSECGRKPPKAEWTAGRYLSNFCPMCGADMRERDDGQT